MTQNEIIAMARQADIWTEKDFMFADVLNPKVEAFAKLVAAHERERCCAIIYSQCDSDNVAQRTVDAIRGQQ